MNPGVSQMQAEAYLKLAGHVVTDRLISLDSVRSYVAGLSPIASEGTAQRNGRNYFGLAMMACAFGNKKYDDFSEEYFLDLSPLAKVLQLSNFTEDDIFNTYFGLAWDAVLHNHPDLNSRLKQISTCEKDTFLKRCHNKIRLQEMQGAAATLEWLIKAFPDEHEPVAGFVQRYGAWLENWVETAHYEPPPPEEHGELGSSATHNLESCTTRTEQEREERWNKIRNSRYSIIYTDIGKLHQLLVEADLVDPGRLNVDLFYFGLKTAWFDDWNFLTLNAAEKEVTTNQKMIFIELVCQMDVVHNVEVWREDVAKSLDKTGADCRKAYKNVKNTELIGLLERLIGDMRKYMRKKVA